MKNTFLTIKIVQDSQARWHIEDGKGHIWQENITVSNPRDAKEVLIRYMSSFFAWNDWKYEVISLDRSKK